MDVSGDLFSVALIKQTAVLLFVVFEGLSCVIALTFDPCKSLKVRDGDRGSKLTPCDPKLVDLFRSGAVGLKPLIRRNSQYNGFVVGILAYRSKLVQVEATQ